MGGANVSRLAMGCTLHEVSGKRSKTCSGTLKSSQDRAQPLHSLYARFPRGERRQSQETLSSGAEARAWDGHHLQQSETGRQDSARVRMCVCARGTGLEGCDRCCRMQTRQTAIRVEHSNQTDSWRLPVSSRKSGDVVSLLHDCRRRAN